MHPIFEDLENLSSLHKVHRKNGECDYYSNTKIEIEKEEWIELNPNFINIKNAIILDYDIGDEEITIDADGMILTSIKKNCKLPQLILPYYEKVRFTINASSIRLLIGYFNVNIHNIELYGKFIQSHFRYINVKSSDMIYDISHIMPRTPIVSSSCSFIGDKKQNITIDNDKCIFEKNHDDGVILVELQLLNMLMYKNGSIALKYCL